jgi:hypothetical protein
MKAGLSIVIRLSIAVFENIKQYQDFNCCNNGISQQAKKKVCGASLAPGAMIL